MIGTSRYILRQVITDVYSQDSVLMNILAVSRIQVRPNHNDHVSLLALGGLDRTRDNLDVLFLDLEIVNMLYFNTLQTV